MWCVRRPIEQKTAQRNAWDNSVAVALSARGAFTKAMAATTAAGQESVVPATGAVAEVAAGVMYRRLCFRNDFSQSFAWATAVFRVLRAFVVSALELQMQR